MKYSKQKTNYLKRKTKSLILTERKSSRSGFSFFKDKRQTLELFSTRPLLRFAYNHYLSTL